MKFLVLPGDGIGPEIVAAAVEVLQAADRRFGLDVHLDFEDVGFASLNKHGTTLREDVLQKARGYDGIILGTQSHADYPAPEKGGRNISAAFRVGVFGVRGDVVAEGEVDGGAADGEVAGVDVGGPRLLRRAGLRLGRACTVCHGRFSWSLRGIWLAPVGV